MAPDDVMVYTGTALVPAVTCLATVLALRGVYCKAISVLTSCIVLIITVLAGMVVSFAFVNHFGYLLHGDGALAIVAAPVTGAIMSIPIALIFAVALIVITSKRKRSSSDIPG
jgi:hypothetical protein